MTIVVISGGMLVGAALVVVNLLMSSSSDKSGGKKSQAEKIIKSYGSEIVMVKNALDLDGLKIVEIAAFEELMKLSVNLGKHITCSRTTDKTEFCCIVDGYAYYYCIDHVRFMARIQSQSEAIEGLLSEDDVNDEIADWKPRIK